MWLRIGLMSAVLIQTLHMINAQDCPDKFLNGKKDFVVDLQASVERGAELIASSQVTKAEDCMETCCLLPQCNVVLVDERSSGRSTCSLFNCLYKKGYACRFVGKKGFSSFVLDSVYQQHLDAPEAEGQSAGPVAVAGRNVVVRPGEEVTLRGVESRAPEDATITSYRWSIKKGNPSVGMTPTGDQLRVSNLVAGTYVFTLHVTDSKGDSDDATVSIQVLNQEESDMYCLVAKEVGLCRASFPRWHYNAATARCEEFVYGGCKGNNNNFLTEPECGKACANVKAPTGRSVTLPGKEDCTAPCGDEEFECASGCCIDRSQECDGQAQCTDGSDESRCAQLNETFSSLLEVSFADHLAFCTEPPKVGPCYENQSAWYYNPIQQQCHPFIYSGCQGNDNHFESKDECEKSCHGVTRSALFATGRFEELEGSDSGSIAIAIVLAVSILALLAVLAFFFLKGHKKGAHQPVATAPPLSGEGGEDDTVVYRSTTKPV
ncbi:kunitz-type protease inhibitor 1-like [Gadus chalcogrammus]|uniref:kunitz-type protease inhibitor 1-like n=1 Tax=Gadus chalcogrammus TaxID=1042646 RepID=UPI0024C4CED2|nr:kunitz-type protease inhibitor 1-like [Gadus chalcogrammus]